MNLDLLIPLSATSIITVLGWYFVHNLNRLRDIQNKRKELRVSYLIEVWRKLNHVSNRSTDRTEEEEMNERLVFLEQIITDIQLFGSSTQIGLAKQILSELKKEGKVNLDKLLNDLRSSLREELSLEPIEERVFFFRVTK